MSLKFIKQVSPYKVVLPAMEAMAEHLQTLPHTDLTPAMASGSGFVKMEVSGDYVAPFHGGYAFALRYDEKVVPGSVVKDELAKWVERFKEREGYTPGRKEQRGMREQVVASLNAVALVRSKTVVCYYRPAEQLLIVPTISRKLKDTIMGQLVRAVESMKSTTIHVSTAKGSLTARLVSHMADTSEAFENFDVGDRVVIVGPNGKSSFDMTDLTDAADGINEAFTAGGQVSEIGLLFSGVDFRLTQDFLLKGVVFTDDGQEQLDLEEDHAAQFEHEAGVQTLLVSRIVTALCEMFDYTPKIEESDDELV
jgi:recombination associated protein RdgC